MLVGRPYKPIYLTTLLSYYSGCPPTHPFILHCQADQSTLLGNTSELGYSSPSAYTLIGPVSLYLYRSLTQLAVAKPDLPKNNFLDTAVQLLERARSEAVNNVNRVMVSAY